MIGWLIAGLGMVPLLIALAATARYPWARDRWGDIAVAACGTHFMLVAIGASLADGWGEPPLYTATFWLLFVAMPTVIGARRFQRTGDGLGQ